MKPIVSPTLHLAVATLDDIEDLRIASESRLRMLLRDEPDADGEMRGQALPIDHPDVVKARAIFQSIADLEIAQVKIVQGLTKKHPLHAGWVAVSPGVGEKQAARLLAAIGDPYMADRIMKTPQGKTLSVETGPRTLREFLSYCGYGVASDGKARRRVKGEKSNWNVEAKMRAYLIANSIIKKKSHLRDVYDAARAKHDTATHSAPCVRCGPSGKPAEAGSTLSPGHAHARALRAVSIRVLTDVYNEAKRLHEEADNG